jgi:hypothetical protein
MLVVLANVALEMRHDNDNGFFQFLAGSLNLQPEKAAELLLRFARKCPME